MRKMRATQVSSMEARRSGLKAALAALAFVAGLAPAAAQNYSIGRGPQINIAPRVPNIAPHMPNVHYSPQVRYGERDEPPPRKSARKNPAKEKVVKQTPNDPPASPRRRPTAAASQDFVPNEVVIEVDGKPSEQETDALARRHRLTRVESQSFDITGTTMFRWRIPDGRSVANVVRQLQQDASIRSVQPNFRFTLQQAGQGAEAPAGPRQYVAQKLRLPEAHALTSGAGVIVAVIDSAVDVDHPELAGVIAGQFDALEDGEKAHIHGTGIAGAIAAHARLTGAAPAARLLAIRAFGANGGSADSTTFNILRSLEYAVKQGAQVINMSFAGPQDRLLARALEGAARRGIVLVAAAGNAGPKSPPLFPAADPHVIAVSATDAGDRLFKASNRGKHVAISAPGVDVLVPAPEGKYQITSGTSFAAAYVSGIAALLIERRPDVTPDVLRQVLTRTARDLGPPGRDEEFGAGITDALSAVVSVDRVPVTEVSARPSPGERR